MGGDCVAFQADLRREGGAAQLIGKVTEHFGRMDILVNSAAIFMADELAETTEESWDDLFDINLKAPFFLCRAFAEHVGRERTGQIVNIADWRATRPGPRYLAYTLTKAGLIAMTQGLAHALAPNIRVNAIAPGAILPPPGQGRGYLERLAATIPLQRTGAPEDVAGALLFLLRADFVTGELVFVTGGEHL
jgi:pteridine reductase